MLGEKKKAQLDGASFCFQDAHVCVFANPLQRFHKTKASPQPRSVRISMATSCSTAKSFLISVGRSRAICLPFASTHSSRHASTTTFNKWVENNIYAIITCFCMKYKTRDEEYGGAGGGWSPHQKQVKHVEQERLLLGSDPRSVWEKMTSWATVRTLDTRKEQKMDTCAASFKSAVLNLSRGLKADLRLIRSSPDLP